jgi:MinD superfamily P-loop ATPase
MGDDRVERYCADQHVPIWGCIPHDRRVAEAYAQGLLAVDVVSEMEGHFAALADRLLAEAGV